MIHLLTIVRFSLCECDRKEDLPGMFVVEEEGNKQKLRSLLSSVRMEDIRGSDIICRWHRRLRQCYNGQYSSPKLTQHLCLSLKDVRNSELSLQKTLGGLFMLWRWQDFGLWVG